MATQTATAETTPIAVGTPAPDFRLPDHNGKEFHLRDFLGRRTVILFFYPLDWSPTCTKENACFTGSLERFQAYGEVAAISTDSVYSHRAWAEHMKLKHRLLSDVHRAVAKAYGLYFPDANINQRATVIAGKDGRIAWVKVEPDITKERDYAEVEAVLARLAK
ncbi:MAG: redoxin domain-containing protein [Elusimicrobia bacterium]|nr:redoxin domain-containing protein [Elusimicrobiota bacterium]